MRNKMPISGRFGPSHKTGRKWKRIGNISKWLKLEAGCSNKKPEIELEVIVEEYLEEIKDDSQ